MSGEGNPCVPWFGGYSSSVDYYMSGALYIGYTPYPRSNVEYYWWSQENPKTQWAHSSQFAGSGSGDNSWGLYQTTIPSMYGQFNYWTCSADRGTPNFTCCPQLIPGVSYNTKMLIVWDSWNGANLSPSIGIGDNTPIFWLTSASGMAPCDSDFNNYGSYPFGHFSEVIADICPWNYTQSITESVDGNWELGFHNALVTASYLGQQGGIIILKNNDVRGLDLFQNRQRWNPRLYNCWPPFNSDAKIMYSLTPMQWKTMQSPFDDPYTYKPWLEADFDGWSPVPSDASVTFSYDPINEIETSESFHYPVSQPYGWKSKNDLLEAVDEYTFEQQTGSMTIELLIKPTMGTRGINMNNADGVVNDAGVDPTSIVSLGNWMPLITKWGYLSEYSVYVDTYESMSIAFGSKPQSFADLVWFTTPMNTITKDSVYDWNQWIHVCFTRNILLKTLPDGTQQTPAEQLYDPDVFKWYINGEPVCSASLDSFGLDINECNPDYRSVKYCYNSESFLQSWGKEMVWYSGSMGFARIYDRALNQYQVKTNFLKSGIWTDFQGAKDEVDFIYNAYNPQTGEDEDFQVKYVLNGGMSCSLQVMFDHGNLVSDHGMNNTTESYIRNIRQYSSSFDGAFSGSDFGGGEVYVTDLIISQSEDAYQTYDAMNGARYFPGSVLDDKGTDNFAYMHVDKVSTDCKYQEGSVQVLEMWVRLSPSTRNEGYGNNGRVIFTNGAKNDGNNTRATADWGIMYDSKGIGFWDGEIHYGVYYAQAGDVRDRWAYIQAVFNIDGWTNNASDGRGTGMVLGINGKYWVSGSSSNYDLYLQTLTGGPNWTNVNEPPFGFLSGSLYFMGHWEGQEGHNASGSIAEIRFYNTNLQYTGSASYAYGPDWGSGCVNQGGDVPCTESLDSNPTTPWDWLRHNWEASKVRFGMGGDSSFT